MPDMGRKNLKYSGDEYEIKEIGFVSRHKASLV